MPRRRLPMINSYQDLVTFNNKISNPVGTLEIQRVSYSENSITVNGDKEGLDTFIYEYVKANNKVLIGKVHRLKQYDFSKLLCLCHPNVFRDRFQAYANNLIMLGDNELKLWDFDIELKDRDIILANNNNEYAREVIIPYFITKIGKSAFLLNTYLRNVVFQEGSKLEDISLYAFYQCRSLQGIRLPANLKTIGDCAFSDNPNLEEINLPDSLEQIGTGAFANTGLTQITIPPNLITIGNTAFSRCTKLSKIQFANNSKLKTIGRYAFQFTGLIEVELPSSLENLQGGAFQMCENLTSIFIPKSVKKLGKELFWNCPKLSRTFWEKGIVGE